MEDIFESVSYFLNRYLSLFYRQFQRTYEELDRRQILQIGAIVGGYLIVRPFIVKLFDWGQRRSMGKEDEKKKKKETKRTKPAVPNKTSPNTLRYGPLSKEVEVSDDTASDDSDSKPVTEEDRRDQKLRRRQRRLLRAKLDEGEMEKFAEKEWEDPDIADLFPSASKS